MSIEVGQTWREVDPRFERRVTVVGFCEESGKVKIECAGKVTKAKRERFNGKRGGYELVTAS
ncbi:MULTISPECIES: hypothetical protein [Pseudomonas]|uniref:hypothetical protein n=1 Tax=Pseudomonas TaxID=286 RepID=UPI00070C54E4|nr:MULTISPECIES: hypothetical protein [Pseudomonas]KQW19732.1 hypothetical protein ASC85_07720 [Pseudomonas sp. Root401]WHS57641.1 hypothetical protein QLH64_30270 [Pseudomonas brassicacearum]WNZ87279.1 hypothetical protein QOM10_30480 [Pseudomonas sp. P108]